MPDFPKSEGDIVILAQVMVQGFTEGAIDLPAPPMTAAELQLKLETFTAALAATVLAETAIRESHAAKDRAQRELVNGMRANIRYAQSMLRGQPEKLSKLGWGPNRSPSALEAPGEVRDIILGTQGDSWLTLRWNQPVKGGTPAFYKIQRKREGTPWEDVGTSTTTEHLVINQPRGVELTYQVVAVNKAGQGAPSGIVTAVL